MVTNYHVVWPYEAVWVVFPDGTELENVPVVGWDAMADLAVLGPVRVSAQPLKLQDAEDAALGSELLLVGYPAEVDLFPQPSITRGILSRFREWERLGMTYFQTDAAIAGGQSGGALVNSKGEVIGISGLTFSEAGFGLAASSADIAPIVESLIKGDFTSGLGDRRIPAGRGSFEFDLDLENYWDSRTFVLDAAVGTILGVAIEGSGDGWFHISDPLGLLLEVNDDYAGVESGEVELLLSGVHFLQVEMATGDSSGFELASNVRLKPLDDPDDGRTITIGETVAGNLDHFSDLDWYSISLEEGETVKISTDSLIADTVLYVDFPGSRDNQVVSDDDSGGGLFGTNSELVYRAPKTGEFIIAVAEASQEFFGGYYLSVERARDGTETVYVPPSPQVVDSRVGKMVVFEDPWGYFSVQVPDAWLEGELDESLGEIFYVFDPQGTGAFTVYLEQRSELSLSTYADELESGLLDQGADVITRETFETAQELTVVQFVWSIGESVGAWLAFLSDDGIAMVIAYTSTADLYDAGSQLAAYSFSTFQVN